MCSIIALLALLLFGVGGYSAIAPAVPAQGVPEVASPAVVSCATASAEEDVRAMLDLFGDTFASGDWTEQISTSDTKTTATWLSSSLGAVAYLEYLHYDCGVTEEQIDAYYSPEGFDVLLSSYDTHEFTLSCELSDTRLYEFDATLSGNAYHILYWVEQVSATRVAGLMLVVPLTNRTDQVDLAFELYPELPTCSPAAA